MRRLKRVRIQQVLDDDPLVFEFLLHRADEYLQFLIHGRPSKIVLNVYLTSPELSIRVAGIPANFVWPACVGFMFATGHQFPFALASVWRWRREAAGGVAERSE